MVLAISGQHWCTWEKSLSQSPYRLSGPTGFEKRQPKTRKKTALRKSCLTLAKHKTFQLLKKGLGGKVGRTNIGVMMDVALHVN